MFETSHENQKPQNYDTRERLMHVNEPPTSTSKTCSEQLIMHWDNLDFCKFKDFDLQNHQKKQSDNNISAEAEIHTTFDSR